MSSPSGLRCPANLDFTAGAQVTSIAPEGGRRGSFECAALRATAHHQFADARQVFAAPVEVAVLEQIARHPEHARRLRLLLDLLQLAPAFAVQESWKMFRIRAALREHARQRVRI